MTVQEAKDRIGIDWGLGLSAILIGLALRLAYATYASPYIDEFTTIWAARQVLTGGLPQFPTGALYTQGLIYTYLEAGTLALGGVSNLLLARVPSLALSTVTLALIVCAARSLFRTSPVGLAALWLAVDSQAIIWGGRVRTYALLQLAILAAFLLWYQGAVAKDRAVLRWLAIALLLAALVDQPLILLLLPPLALLALAARGWGWLRQPVVWLQVGVVAAGVVFRWILYRLMIPADSIVAVEPRAFVDLAHPFAEWEALIPFFTDPNRLVPLLLLLGGVSWLLFSSKAPTLVWRKPVLALAFLLVSVALEMLLVVGISWRHTRYLYPLLPLLFLGGEGVAVPVLRGLAERLRFLPIRGALVGLTAVLILLSAWLAYPDTRGATTREEWGYDRAMAVVGEAWVEGDALATIAPMAAFVHLGHCDYLAIEEGGSALMVERDGRRLDSWTGLPLLDSPERLVEALEVHSRLWFVADEVRLNRHFSPDYLRLLWDRFDLMAFERGTFVFRSHLAETPVVVDRTLDADFNGQLHLKGYVLSDDRLEPGGVVTTTLRWVAVAPQGQYVAFVHVTDQAGKGISGHDAPPLEGLYPVDRWPRSSRSQPFPDRHPLILPAELPPGRYRIEAGLYRPSTLEPVGERVTLDFLQREGDIVELPPYTLAVRFGDAATLFFVGLEGDFRPGGMAQLSLAWHTGPAGFDADYTVFLHLLDAEGNIAQQWDAPPVGGWYPTSYWDPGEIIADDHALDFSPMLSRGEYRLILGLYRADGARLALDDGTDSVELATLELGP